MRCYPPSYYVAPFVLFIFKIVILLSSKEVHAHTPRGMDLELSCRDYIEKIPGITTMGVTHGDKNAILAVYTTKVKYSNSSITVKDIQHTTFALKASSNINSIRSMH